MKLHLPVGLRVALLAVLASFSVAFGEVTVKQNITAENPDGEEVTVPEGGVIEGGLEKDVSVVLTSDGEEEILTLKGKIGAEGKSDVKVGANCELTLIKAFLGYQDKDNGSVETTIEVDGGKFVVGDGTYSGGSSVGTLEGEYSTGSLKIDVINGGEFSVLSSYDHVGKTTAWHGKNVVEINVTSNATFTNNGSVGEVSNGSNTGAEPDTTITISDGGTFNLGGYIGRCSGSDEEGTSFRHTSMC